MDTDSSKKSKQQEVDANFRSFERLLKEGNIPPEKYNTYALMRNEEIVGYYDTWHDAEQAGSLAYADRTFSVQEVTQSTFDLGYYSHAFV